MSASPSSAAAKVEALEVYVPLNKLEEGVLSTVKVMVCRKWDSLNSYGKYLSTEYILSDCEALLHFMYWDDLPNMQEFSGLSSNGSFTIMAQHLLAASDRYGLDRLRLLCEARLCEDVAINTVATTLALAEQHHCFQLKAVCLKFIASRENLKAVMQTEGFNYLKESCPTVLTELLECVAKISEHSIPVLGYGDECMLDGSDVNGRRVKQRFF